MSTPRTDAQAGWAIANQYGQSTASELLGATDGVFVHAVFARTLERELIAITAERDQLRAEVERLTKQIKDDNRSYGCELRDPNGTIWQQATKDHARAERAEAAETVALAKWNGALERALKAEADLAALEQCHDDNCRAVVRLDAELAAAKERLRSEAMDDYASIKNAARELATERARLRQVALDACKSALIKPMVWSPSGYFMNPKDLGKINEQQVEACFAAIDAAMKEGVK